MLDDQMGRGMPLLMENRMPQFRHDAIPQLHKFSSMMDWDEKQGRENWLLIALAHWVPKCGPCSISISVMWKPDRNACS